MKTPGGPRMQQAVNYVTACGGSVRGMWNVSKACGPHGSNSYGYRTVQRCLKAGLLKATADSSGVWTVTLP